MPLNIIIADQHAVVRRGIVFLIKDAAPYSSIEQTEDAHSTLTLLEKQKVDLLICDIDIIGGDSASNISAIRKIQPDLKILIFSASNQELYAFRYMKAGANGYLNKNSSEQEIKHAIISVLETGKYMSKSLAQQLMATVTQECGHSHPHKLKDLSNREAEVAALLIKGWGLLEISNQLNIQMSTASTYKTRLFEKLGIHNVADLISLFNDENMIV